MLGLGISRAQACTIRVEAMWNHNSRGLSLADVVLDNVNYGIWFGIKHSKGDPFRKQKDKTGRDWIPIKGTRSENHCVNIVLMTKLYAAIMGFDLQTEKPTQHASDKSGLNNIPFFQSFDTSGKPTGKAMLYGELLRELKKDLADITDTFPELVPENYGTHAFRRMGASIAKCNGVPDDLIQYMGRWVSQCFQRYFIFSDSEKMEINGMILN